MVGEGVGPLLLHLLSRPPSTPTSLLSLTFVFKGTEAALLIKFYRDFARDPAFEKPRMATNAFIVRHYSGAVEYTLNSFLDKNRFTNFLFRNLSRYL